jgi:signal transduction histidine kinase
MSFLFAFIGVLWCHTNANLPQQEPYDSAAYYAYHYYNKVLKPDSKTDLLEAFVYYRNKKETDFKKADTLNTIYSLRQIAIIQKKLGILYDSETTAIEALNLLDKLPDTEINKESKAGIYNHLGRVYSEMEDYTNAIFYYQKALELSETKLQSLVLRNNIAYAHYNQNNLILAQEEFKAIYNESLVYNDSVIIARTLNNLGMVKGKLKDSTALIDFENALAIRLSLGNNSDILGSYLDLSEYFKEQGDLVQARLYAQKAYQLAKVSKNPTHLSHALGLLLDLKEDDEVHSYKHLMDSIQKANLMVEGKYASKKYTLAKQEALAKERLLQLEKEKNYKYLYAFLTLFALSLGAITLIFQKLRFKKEKEIEVYNTELRISKKVHDEVANGVYHIMTKMQQKDQNNETVLDDLELVYNKTRDISREHHDIHVEEDFKGLLLDLIVNYKNEQVNIIAKDISKIDWNKVKNNKKVAIYRVIQELLINMKKHSQASIVVLSFNQNQNKLAIEYTDNGVGCIIKKQNGLLNTENRIKTLNGSITFKSQIDEGFHVLIQL